MNELLNTLLGLDDPGFGSSGVRLVFERPIPGWGWALVVLGAAGAGWWSYRRLGGRRATRVPLAASRALPAAVSTSSEGPAQAVASGRRTRSRKAHAPSA